MWISIERNKLNNIFRRICGILTYLYDDTYLRDCKFLDIEGPPFTTLKFGLLYNWYVTTDPRNIANVGWHVSTVQNLWDLMLAVDPDGDFPVPPNDAGGKFKEIGLTYWNDPNVGATNEAGFNARGAGERDGTTGIFGYLKDAVYFWTNEEIGDNGILSWISGLDSMFMLSKPGGGWQIDNKKTGKSIRPIKDSTTLSHGQTGIYIGNDGKVYPTICIGTQECLAENLAETKYRNGDLIPEITDNATWAGLTTGALCAYENDHNNI